jgi:two-component system sensor histidine kinase VanS
MSPGSFRTYRRAFLLRQRLAWTSYALLVAASGLAMGLVLFTRNREKVLADRLANLTHSLKTPLAVLRLRCETALNIDLSRESQEARLLEIRSEVDHLVRTIEGGLEQMRAHHRGRTLDRIDDAFFENLDEDLTPAFEAQNRMLEVYGGGVAFRCSATVLRAALATLAENALIHGAGRVAVKAGLEKGAVTVTVSDEGPGIPVERLQDLRSGLTAPSGGADRGHGLGLLVLARIARQEGWGLAFRTEEGGFSAMLSIPA